MRLQPMALALSVSGAALAVPGTGRPGQPQFLRASRNDVSAPLTLLDASPRQEGLEDEERGPRPLPHQFALAAPTRDPVLQDAAAPLLVPPQIGNFEGIGLGFLGAGTKGFDVTGLPPDPQGDVGPNHYVQIVNSSLAVFGKDGKAILGPIPTRTIFANFGGPCETHDDGDGIALYDPLADRWLVAQFAVVTTGDQRFHECVAVSRTGDPTGAWARYDYVFRGFNDYPKFGVWPDGYYATYNSFPDQTSTQFDGVNYCVMDRARMLTGDAAAQQCILIGDKLGGLVPGDLDGYLPPPAGEPNTAVGFGRDILALYRFRVDWENPLNSFIEPTTLVVAPFAEACFANRGGACIPQPGTGSPPLDALGDRLMYRAAYRNFGEHESMVVNHSVTVNGVSGVRWYEIRDPAGTPSLFQQGTYAPDSSWRWMGSAAMDRAGDVGLGFSLINPSMPASIGYTAHAASDPPGVMGQGESIAVNGGGTQAVRLRWGDYSSMSVDPADECTFWYTNEYIPTDGIFNWHTRISSFEVPGCRAAPDYSIWPDEQQAVGRGQQPVSVKLNTAPLLAAAAARQLTLAVNSLPRGVTGAIQPTTVAPGQTATLTLTAVADAEFGRGQGYVVTATSPEGIVASASGALDVVDADFSMTPDKTEVVAVSGASNTVGITTQALFGTPEVINFSAEGVREGVAVRFDPQRITAGQSTTMIVTGASGLPASSAAVTVVADALSTSHRAVLHVRALSAPRAQITWPAAQQSVSGKAQVIAAAATSPAATLLGMELLVDGKRIDGVFANVSPAVLTWDSHVVSDGEHLLVVRATDNHGGLGLSDPVAVVVQNKGDCGCSGTGGGWESLGLLGLLSTLRRRRRP
ncbi:MAG TPA: hypothetical protein VFL36_07610 [Myxococcales bacterium]|nr:hypothetical protein [Myxococcales bacterium]